MTKDNSRDELALKIVSQNIKEGDFTSDHSTDQVCSIPQPYTNNCVSSNEMVG